MRYPLASYFAVAACNAIATIERQLLIGELASAIDFKLVRHFNNYPKDS